MHWGCSLWVFVYKTFMGLLERLGCCSGARLVSSLSASLTGSSASDTKPPACSVLSAPCCQTGYSEVIVPVPYRSLPLISAHSFSLCLPHPFVLMGHSNVKHCASLPPTMSHNSHLDIYLWRFRNESYPVTEMVAPFLHVSLGDQESAIRLLLPFQMCQSITQEQQKMQ